MPSPYKIDKHPHAELYTFTTTQGLEFSCTFSRPPDILSPLIGTYDLEVRDFSFYPYDARPHIRKQSDERILPSLLEIIDDFFSDPNRVMVFTCDDSEGEIKARARQKLFSEWYENRSATLELHEIEIEIEEDNKTILGGVIFRHDCPHPRIIHEHLIDKAGDIVFEKYGR